MKSIRSWVAVFSVIGLLAGCKRDDQIQTYQAPKDQPAAAPAGQSQGVAAAPMTGADAPVVPVNSSPLHYTTPPSWKEIPPSGVFLADFQIPGPGGKKAELTVTSFPGDVGGTLANVNRWRGQVGLGDTTENEITSEKTMVDASEGKLYDLTGASERIVVAVIMRDGASWFFKMRGDSDVVASAKPVFLEFLKSVHFGGSDAAPAAADPHAGLPGMGAGTAMAEPVNSAGQPKWNPPANWTETTPGQLVVKSFSITGDAGQKAAVSISVLGSVGGGTLANVNRWRRQLKLAEITEDALPKATESLDVLGGKALLVDFTGTDAAGQPAQMVAASVPHGDQTWYYKLTGAPGVVSKEKEPFLNFVQGVHYP